MSSRRSFLKKLAISSTLFPLLKMGEALAAACPQAAPKDAKIVKKLLDYKGKTAKRLNFVANAVDAKGHKKYKAGDNCGNCKFYKPAGKPYAKCSMAGNKYVPACGWCKSYKVNKKLKKKKA